MFPDCSQSHSSDATTIGSFHIVSAPDDAYRRRFASSSDAVKRKEFIPCATPPKAPMTLVFCLSVTATDLPFRNSPSNETLTTATTYSFPGFVANFVNAHC